MEGWLPNVCYTVPSAYAGIAERFALFGMKPAEPGVEDRERSFLDIRSVYGCFMMGRILLPRALRVLRAGSSASLETVASWVRMARPASAD
jgi:hypothetical protein